MINWLENPIRRIPMVEQLKLVEAAYAQRPGDPRLLGQIGFLQQRLGSSVAALDALEASLWIDPEGFAHWAALADVHTCLQDHEAALSVCERGMDANPDGHLASVYGDLLAKRGRLGEAQRAYRRGVDLPGIDPLSLRKVLPFVFAEHAHACLEFCDALRPVYRHTALVRAWRAIALSKLGRRDDAMALINPAEHMHRIPFEPPAEFGGIEAFNRMLADEILADPPDQPSGEGLLINTVPRRLDKPALLAFHAFARTALAEAAAESDRYGLHDAPKPLSASLDAGTTVLIGNGTNRQHVHYLSYLTAIYHVRVPESVRQTEDRAGSLELGGCDQVAHGYQPCWSRRYVKPVEGWLTIIPSHMFHDVIATGHSAPRISTVADLKPLAA